MKETPKEVKIQWHAYFAQVMEKICTRKDFLVEKKAKLPRRAKEVAKMPLKIDVMVIKNRMLNTGI